MSKVFPHKPLGRAELRRLCEEPKPIEARPGPTVRLKEPLPDPEKAKRAQERLEERERERKLATLIDAFCEHCLPVVIRGPAFLRWLVEGLHQAADRGEFIEDANIVTLTECIEECLVCGAANPITPAKSAFVVWPDIFPKQGESIAAVACERCAGLQPRFYARMLVMSVLESITKPDIPPGRMRKLKLLENDRKLLAWVAQPRQGNDRHAVGRAIDGGMMDRVMSDVERLILEDDEKFRNDIPPGWTIKQV